MSSVSRDGVTRGPTQRTPCRVESYFSCPRATRTALVSRVPRPGASWRGSPSLRQIDDALMHRHPGSDFRRFLGAGGASAIADVENRRRRRVGEGVGGF